MYEQKVAKRRSHNQRREIAAKGAQKDAKKSFEQKAAKVAKLEAATEEEKYRKRHKKRKTEILARIRPKVTEGGAALELATPPRKFC